MQYSCRGVLLCLLQLLVFFFFVNPSSAVFLSLNLNLRSGVTLLLDLDVTGDLVFPLKKEKLTEQRQYHGTKYYSLLYLARHIPSKMGPLQMLQVDQTTL